MKQDKHESVSYEEPTVVDHGDLTELTAAGNPFGSFDADYSQGQAIPPGGPGNQSQP